MDFRILEAILGLDGGYLLISLTPVPDWDGNAGEYKMGGVARNVGSAGLVYIAKVQSRNSRSSAKKCDWAVRAMGPKVRRLATLPRRKVLIRGLWNGCQAGNGKRRGGLRCLLGWIGKRRIIGF